MSYKEQLTDPRWQRKRLEIFNRDNWTCQCCGSKTTQLEVHHVEYFDGLKAWEYPDDMLLSTCRDCHNTENVRFKHENELLKALKLSGFYAYDVLAMATMVHGFKHFRKFLRTQVDAFKKANS